MEELKNSTDSNKFKLYKFNPSMIPSDIKILKLNTIKSYFLDSENKSQKETNVSSFLHDVIKEHNKGKLNGKKKRRKKIK